jgi:dephospho-CoA kinase
MRIALVGKKASGKTLVAAYLKKQYRFKLKRLRDGTERILRILYDYEPYAHVSWEQEIYIYDALYKIDNNIWIGYLERRLKKSNSEHIVIDDVRYINEVNKLRELGFTIVRVTSPDEDRHRRIGKGLARALQGSVILTEYFDRDNTEAYVADYTINATRDRLATKHSVDILVEKLDK